MKYILDFRRYCKLKCQHTGAEMTADFISSEYSFIFDELASLLNLAVYFCTTCPVLKLRIEARIPIEYLSV